MTVRTLGKESVKKAFEAGAVPLFVIWMEKLNNCPTLAWLGLTVLSITKFGIIVPVIVGVGGVPDTVGVGVVGVAVGLVDALATLEYAEAPVLLTARTR